MQFSELSVMIALAYVFRTMNFINPETCPEVNKLFWTHDVSEVSTEQLWG